MDYELPRPKGPFTDSQALELLISYRRDPSNVSCPTCGPGQIEVLAFIKPEIVEGFAEMCEPEGNYAAALYCHHCELAIGVLPSMA